MKIILLSGKRYAGKDEVKNILLKLLNNCISVSLADECKRMYAKSENLDHNLLINDREYKEKYRDGLTEFYKKSLIINPYFFELYVNGIIKSSSCEFVIISDIRTTNNLNFFKDIYTKDCLTIRIESSDNEKTKRGWVKSQYDNLSIETELDNIIKWDYVVHNNGTIYELINTICEITNKINNK